MAKSTFHHPKLGEVSLSANPRARRLTLSVRPSGEVCLSYPPTLSAKRALIFLEERIEWVEHARKRMEERAAAIRDVSPTREEVEQLRRAAREELPPRVAELARQFGFRYGRITIRAARTKWGCCTARNNLSLSLFLMKLPPHLRDFVLLHELCHTVHHNHSPRFHALLDQCVRGREKELNRELKRYTIR